jgi:hypothetical protein
MRSSAQGSHYVTTSDSVSGSYLTPVPVVTVDATRCIELDDAKRGPPPTASSDDKVLPWLGAESSIVATGVEGCCDIR